MRSLLRNATVGALIYEFLFDVYRLIEAERQHNLHLPDEDGVLREAFCHNSTSCWEWSTSVLEEAGVTKTFKSPPPVLKDIKPDPNRRSAYSYPLLTLDECQAADFSAFETFDNYCYAMFTLWQLVGQMSSNDIVNLAVLSPRFGRCNQGRHLPCRGHLSRAAQGGSLPAKGDDALARDGSSCV